MEGEVDVIFDKYGRGAEVVVMSLIWSKVGRIVIDDNELGDRRVEVDIGDEGMMVKKSRAELMLTFILMILPSAV